MDTKAHYDNHLGNFYSWMIGDFSVKQNEFQDFLEANRILPQSSQLAIDLGAGNGIQSVSLANLGFSVKAIDFNKQLLDELRTNSKNLKVEIFEEDIREVAKYANLQPELILCCGDTITHLDDKNDIRELITSIHKTLPPNGKLILSFRDYSQTLTGYDRFIPVRSDENRIHTCFLEYGEEYVTVTDLLHEKTETGWNQKVSSFKKVRITTQDILGFLENHSMKIIFNKPVNRLTTIIASK
ncbi:SAM-dependent methyltransferase [Leptospira kobayashii]|uniref:SAM-dependent methyltransferase n=1 Tax=Leptospira kobayashii TaxID=1917830 RepID=A0ABN6KB44_9LEPT|nr:class I SAM-dependent methyltransferase [Leptospira kobayashii]BDA77785.1 SAM-dependent methyltransferase [Leptospira kobayashii]